MEEDALCGSSALLASSAAEAAWEEETSGSEDADPEDAFAGVDGWQPLKSRTAANKIVSFFIRITSFMGGLAPNTGKTHLLIAHKIANDQTAPIPGKDMPPSGRQPPVREGAFNRKFIRYYYNKFHARKMDNP